MSIYDGVVGVLDRSLTDAGFVVNSGRESTTGLYKGGEVLTYVADVNGTPSQQSQFFTYRFSYIVKLIQGAEYDGDDVLVKSKEQATSDNYDLIIKTVFSNIQATSADNVNLVDGVLSFVTEEKYQSYASLVFEVDYKTRVFV